ncbi:MAG: UvrD-helicase domain-containing protein [Prevotella sp.]|nr:UvrD-helicase domain-containing protein [Prevotella sp.]
MVTPTLTVYKASAGSGKTFRLAVEYIKLVVRDPQCYRHILAVTFTNKATEEMKMRILSQLYGLWKQLPDSQTYMDCICKELQVEPTFVSLQAGQALANLLHNYNYFRVETIDTFFQSVLRNLARELDLTANLRIGLNDTQVEELAVDQLIEDLQTTDVMLIWLLKYIMENINDDHSWNVIGQIKQFGRTIFRDYYKAESKAISERMAEKGFFDHYTKTLRDLRATAKEYMAEIGDKFFSTLASEGFTIDDLANKRRGIASFFLKLQNGVFDASIENTTVANCLGNPAKWYTKTHPRHEEIHMLADGTLGNLLRLAIEQRPRQWRLYQSAELTLRHINQLRLLDSIETKVRQLNHEANRFLLSDTQQLLHALISDSDSPFIFEKIGTQLEHIMIDEFQDTSTVQWQNFRVLLQETMSHEGSQNLIVGDVKQSIYRWRSGDWRLLNDIHSQFPKESIMEKPLDTNHRSSRHVIEFNNAFFQKAALWEYEQLQDMPEAEQLQRAYQSVEQLIPEHRDQSGYVNIDLLPAEDYQENTLSLLTDIVRQLLADGVSQSDIAILVRTNNLIPVIANYFAEQMSNEVSIVSDEAFRLDASLSVNIIVNALRLLANPHDELSHAYLHKIAGQGLPNDTEALLRLPLYELVEQLFIHFQLNRFDDQSAYICAFYDQLADFTADNSSNIDSFLREWDENLCSKTIQSDELSGIRLISIHKSKGLEFDHVICPFCDWQLEKQSGNVLWCHPTEAPFNDLPLVPVDYSQKGMTGTIYEADYRHEHLQNIVDNLNLLYVAFTRASQRLYVIGKRGTKSSRSAVIEAVLPSIEGMLSGENDTESALHYEYGQPEIINTAHTTRHTNNVFLQSPTPCHINVQSFDSRVAFRQSNQSQDFISGDDEQGSYIQLGSVLHHIFSTIRTTADIDDALQRLQLDGILYNNDITAERITTMLRRRLEHPKVADWFSGRWQIFNECTILSMTDGQVVERRPDRVMTDGHEWIVVDFKFGGEHVEYHNQVRQYMDLLRQMGHSHISGYLWYVYSNKIVEVV